METKDIAKETIEVFKYFDTSLTENISKSFWDFLKELSQESNIIVNIDSNKKLRDQNISEECKDLISLIYYNYIADENEKKEILKIWNNNEKIYQKYLNKIYNVDKIFEKKSSKKVAETELPIVYKENIFNKIIKFIKKNLCN